MLLLAMGTAAIGGELLVSRGVMRLVDVVNAYGRDELTARADLRRSPREIRQFAEAFSAMAGRIVARETELKRSAEDKEILLREVHHRVKNNLQVISSFLSLQSRNLRDEAARLALVEARARVRTLALVHDHLHIGDGTQFLDFPTFLRNLAEQLARIHGLPARGIAIEVEAAPIDLSQSSAIALALFITEAISNAIEHAFPPPRGGIIRITLTLPDDGNAVLTVVDDGIGADSAAAEPDSRHSGIGTSLMRAFADQLGGSAETERGEGTRITLRFPLAGRTAGEESGSGLTA
jgi:two-component sensor histidine kinase